MEEKVPIALGLIASLHTGELKRCGDFQGLKVPFMQSHSVLMVYCQNLWIGVEGK